MKFDAKSRETGISVIRFILLFGILATLIPEPISDTSQRYELWPQFLSGLIPLIPFMLLYEKSWQGKMISLVLGTILYLIICDLAVESWNMNLSISR